jgi:rare lipoprotein A
LSACAQQGRYRQHQDSPPSSLPSKVDFTDAVPKYEPYKKANHRPYTIRGVRYTPMQTGLGYSATGEASWYGQKFHGHLTSNGEIYDMYAMSAAHKTLPLPSFARVTNLENGRQVVLRINDRGPFHGGRLIDLSYAAAMKLDVLSTGVAKVKLDVIHVSENGQVNIGNSQSLNYLKASEPNTPNKAFFIQVAALRNKQKITRMAKGLKSLYQVPYHTPEKGGMYRLQLGPINDEKVASELLAELKQNGYDGAYKVYQSE